ncbi:MAG: AAA family ATPase [Ferrovibrionaceae bacterium]
MNAMTTNVNPAPTIAAVRNVALMAQMMDRAISRHPSLPGMFSFSGFSGLGKSFACAYVAQKYRAIHFEVPDDCTKAHLLRTLVEVLGVRTGKTIPEMRQAITDEMRDSRTPLIIDEADRALRRGLIELIRDIHTFSRQPIALVGEENLPQHLRASERVHNRILEWGQAERLNLKEAQAFAAIYCKGIAVRDDLLNYLLAETKGIARRLVVNLDRAASLARGARLVEIGRQDWGDEPVYTGRAPQARAYRDE